MPLIRVVLFLTCVLFSNYSKADFMGISLILFSPVNAVVTMKGAPVAGAKVVRTYKWRWGDKEYSDDTVTDGKGSFRLGSLTASSLTAWLPHEVIIEQEIVVHFNGIAYKIWGCDKGDYKLNGELDGRQINLDFRLELESRRINPVCVGRFLLN